jgi:copper(I)-binding protein
MRFISTLACAAALAAAGTAFAHDYKAGDLIVGHPYARTTVPGQPTGAAYVTIENRGKDADKLVSAASPAAGQVQIHTMSMEGAVMKMREVAHIELKPAAKLAMQPGSGYHLMLMGLKRPLKEGDKFPLTLNFEKAGKLEVTVNVEKPAAKASAHDHHSH